MTEVSVSDKLEHFRSQQEVGQEFEVLLFSLNFYRYFHFTSSLWSEDCDFGAEPLLGSDLTIDVSMNIVFEMYIATLT